MKNPEYVRLIIAAITLWILRFTQDDEHIFYLQYLSSAIEERGEFVYKHYETPLISAMVKMYAVLAHRSIFCAECLPAILCGKALDQLWVRMEFLLAAMELLLAAQDNVRPSLNGLDCPANMDGLVDQSLKVADRFFIPAEADNEKMTVDVGCLRTAYVQKVRAIGRIHHAIHMRCDADAFVDVRERLIRHQAALVAGDGKRSDGDQQGQKPQASPEHERGEPQPKEIASSMPRNR